MPTLRPPKFLTDKAVPPGAETMGDDWIDGGESHGATGAGEVYVPPPPPPAPGTQYVAYCWTCKDEGYFPDVWTGDVRPSQEAAQADADQHGATYGHQANVRSA